MKNKTSLPKWFDGTVYEKGDTVTNPFSGDTYELNNLELSMYDFLKGAEYTLMIMSKQDKTNDKLVDDFHKGRHWFVKNNINAYMALLD